MDVAAAAIFAAAAAPFVISAAGFGATGIVAGSVAAGLQSTIGNVAAGSVFATLQSVGATGVTLGTKAVIGGVGAGVCGTFKIISSYFW